ncbi:Uncharacterized protein FKW44_007980, partial [Caligus rogercresseyi]
KEERIENRILAAETLAYVVEVSAELQRIAAISNHLPEKNKKTAGLGITSSSSCSGEQDERLKVQNESLSKEMQRCAFRVFASLGANDEGIRKRIIEKEQLMVSLVSALEDTQPKLQMAAIACLHSMSRSVQLLRTTFQDHPVWQPLMKMLSVPNASSVESLVVASSTLCNLLLEFSPSKEHILDSGAVDILCELTGRPEEQLRLNGVWGLM